jgi:hypothetical protein
LSAALPVAADATHALNGNDSYSSSSRDLARRDGDFARSTSAPAFTSEAAIAAPL